MPRSVVVTGDHAGGLQGQPERQACRPPPRLLLRLGMASSELIRDPWMMTNLTTGEATHVDPTRLSVLNHVDFLCRVALPGEATGGGISLVEERGRLGCMTPRHVHTREAETFIVLDGALEGWCEGKTRLVEAGQLIHLPANREHAFRVASGDAHFYVLITPAGFETFFPATGTVLDQSFDGELPVPRAVSPEKVGELKAVLTPLGVTLTGPPPFDPS
jgi:quercetin dioxygenase-like cupin family protein